MIELLGPMPPVPEVGWLLVRAVLDLAIAAALVLPCLRHHRDRDHAVTCLLVNAIAFLLCAIPGARGLAACFAAGVLAVYGLRCVGERAGLRDLALLAAAAGVGAASAVM